MPELAPASLEDQGMWLQDSQRKEICELTKSHKKQNKISDYIH